LASTNKNVGSQVSRLITNLSRSSKDLMFFEKKEKMDSHLLQVCPKVSLWLEGK